MIDEFNDDRTGWARFSDDRRMRYRLARSLNGKPIAETLARLLPGEFMGSRCVFVLLNPSTADAFKPDPTATECIKRATLWGFDVVEVVNLFGYRSAYPTDLLKLACGERGDDEANDCAIIDACTGADLVVYAWGNDGELGDRHVVVRALLRDLAIEPVCLGRTKSGFPKHPLARGKHRIPADIPLADLEPWRV